MTFREEIHAYVYQHNKEQYGKCEECEYRTNQILKLFEKMINEKQNIKNLKPATKPEDVIYNSGVFDGLQELRDELKK